jgi:hypothetical protein
MPRLRVAPLTLLVLAIPGGTAHAAADPNPQPRVELQRRAATTDGAQHLHFRFGPVRIHPGQNTIRFTAARQRPKVDFVPATAPAARHMRAVDTDWVDVMGGKA